eukprot:CAMPEP_0174697504 /NCGR_PEP_ID=MMETSP1094-20130205/3350_1 /TAXON_ID=156173 /ORGANISM="Chrysochromulina brevifilum, Strain UTEX LB 985" /LENGTH=183 /DNA_ID=CAMNT_0015894497 /DNA_START=383 /DNA_END=934 /DNA_ORIENTATION=+
MCTTTSGRDHPRSRLRHSLHLSGPFIARKESVKELPAGKRRPRVLCGPLGKSPSSLGVVGAHKQRGKLVEGVKEHEARGVLRVIPLSRVEHLFSELARAVTRRHKVLRSRLEEEAAAAVEVDEQPWCRDEGEKACLRVLEEGKGRRCVWYVDGCAEGRHRPWAAPLLHAVGPEARCPHGEASA